MLSIIFSLMGIFALLIFVETLWIKKHLHEETARKIIHISTGVFVAFWPIWMSWQAIQVVSLLLLAVVIVSQRFRIFNSIHGVARLTRGELLFPIGIGLSAFIAPSPVFFTAAILNLALADGLAAIVGRKLGKLNGYNILGHKKSIAGSLACFFASAVIFTAGFIASGDYGSFPVIQALFIFPLAVTFVENISWYGLDNITVPITVILLIGTL